MRMAVSGGSHQENSGPSRSSNAITLWETVPRVDQKVRKVANGTERKLQVKKKKKQLSTSGKTKGYDHSLL